MNQISLYMKKNNIEKNLQYKIKDYIKYMVKEQDELNPDTLAKIICMLSPALREELLLNANGKIIKEIPFISNHFNSDTIIQLCLRIKEQTFSPDEYIVLVQKKLFSFLKF